MHAPGSLRIPRLGVIALSLALVALILPSLLTASARTDESEQQATWEALRATLVNDDVVPVPLQLALLAKTETVALLLPAVQSAREAARREPPKANECAALAILSALEHQVYAAGKLTYAWDFDEGDLAIIQRDIDLLRTLIVC